MQAKIFFITLAVDDLERSLRFYRDGLGWPTDGVVGTEFHDATTGADGTIAFFQLDGGLLLGLYERTTSPRMRACHQGRAARPSSVSAFRLHRGARSMNSFAWSKRPAGP